jgi:DNA-binding response OmpR family regulator
MAASISIGLVWRSTANPIWQSQEFSPRRVLIVDDDPNLTRLVRAILAASGFDAVPVPNAYEGLDRLEREHFDVIVLDLRMTGLDGRGFYREMRSRGFSQPVLIASAYGAHSAQQELGAQAAIEKPFDPERLVEAVRGLLPPEEAQSSF